MESIVKAVIGTSTVKAKDHTKLESYDKPSDGFITGVATKFEGSREREMMLLAEDYDNVDNKTIDERKRYYIDEDGARQTDANISNNKIKHAKFPLLVDQKVSYLLSKPFTVQAKEDDADAGNANTSGVEAKQELSLEAKKEKLRVKASATMKPNDPVRIDYVGKNQAMADMLSNTFTAKFRRFLRRVVRESIVKGISWVQVYYQGDTVKYKRIPSEQIVPFWTDADHTELEGVLRFYNVAEYTPQGEEKQRRKYEWHTPDGSWYYIVADNGKLVEDPSVNVVGIEAFGGQHGHFAVKDNETEETSYAVWGKVPFVPFKYNGNELSLLKKVHSLIDEFDKSRSDWSNLIEDVPNSLKLVKGYDGENPIEFIRNLNTFKMAFVDEDGGLDSLDSNLDVEALKAHVDQLQKDIFESGSGVDLQNENLGQSSGVALKYRYSGLDIDCRELSNEINASLQQLSWFLKQDLVYKGESDESVLDVEEEYIFNTDIIINETEAITNAQNSKGIISEETIVSNHPWVTDLADEMMRLGAEKETAFNEQQDQFEEQYNRVQGFAQGDNDKLVPKTPKLPLDE